MNHAQNAAQEAAITRARVAKAQKLAQVLLSHGALGPDVAQLPAASRRTVEKLAGVMESSDATWAMVGPIVSTQRALAARIAELAADPFAPFSLSSDAPS